MGLSESDSDAMLKAYNFFFRAWNEVPSQLEDYADLYPLDLDAALVALTDRLYVVSIEATSSTDNVNAIFESLNTKGRALRQVDLLKNFLFLNLGSDAERVLRDSWHPIEDLLDPGEVEHFVWAYMVSQGTYSLQNRTYETIQRQLRGRAEEIEKFVNSLKESASLFDRIIHPDKEPNPIIRREFVDLHQAGNLVWIPMALYCYRRFYSAELDVDALVDALSRIESFLVRRMLCDLSPNNLNSMLGSMLAKLRTSAYRETEDLAADIGRILASRPGDWPTDQDLETRIVSTPFYLRQSTAQRIHVLRKLDAKFSQSGVTPNYEISDSSIEHIAPQNRESITWREDLGPQDWVEVQEELLHTLGNLTLLTPALNSKLGDGQWDTKRAAYREAGYPMTETLGSSTHDRWGPSQIRERSVELANIAKEVWPRLAVPPHEVVAGESAVLAEDLDEEPVSDAELDEGWAEILAVHDDSGEE